jgi:hypothetical protein
MLGEPFSTPLKFINQLGLLHLFKFLHDPITKNRKGDRSNHNFYTHGFTIDENQLT